MGPAKSDRACWLLKGHHSYHRAPTGPRASRSDLCFVPQLNLLIERVDEAVRDFEKCVQLSPEFAVASVQKCYTEYRSVCVCMCVCLTEEGAQCFVKRSKVFLHRKKSMLLLQNEDCRAIFFAQT